jgi:2-polyprenyl-3-methyl-5-hydroxy-6-metoxy-1,4-benzoquinol methylase
MAHATLLGTVKHRVGRWLVSAQARANYIRWFELRYLRRVNPLRHGELLLDAACGIGVFSASLGRRGARTYGFDIARASIGLAGALRLPRAAFFLADAHAIPLADDRFDVVVSICALEHFKDDRAVLAELRRVLRPGGHLLLTVDSFSQPYLPEEYRKAHATRHAVERFYTRETLVSRLEAAGFAVLNTRYLVTSRCATVLARAALRLVPYPALSRWFSLVAIPLGLLGELLGGHDRWGVTLAVVAMKGDR